MTLEGATVAAEASVRTAVTDDPAATAGTTVSAVAVATTATWVVPLPAETDGTTVAAAASHAPDPVMTVFPWAEGATVAVSMVVTGGKAS